MGPLQAIIHDANGHITSTGVVASGYRGVIPNAFHIDIRSGHSALLVLVFQVPLEWDEWVVGHCFLGGEGGQQRSGIRRGHLLPCQHPEGGGGGGGFVNKGVRRENGGFLEDKTLRGGEDIRLRAG